MELIYEDGDRVKKRGRGERQTILLLANRAKNTEKKGEVEK